MVDVSDSLDAFLSSSDEVAVVAFIASCVERVGGDLFLALKSDSSRARDADVYLGILDDLWRGSTLTHDARVAHMETLAAFPELQGEEEPPGILAFAYDAVAAAYYAYVYLVSGEVDNVRYCSNHVLNSAGYLGDIESNESSRSEEELAAQSWDIRNIVESAGKIATDSLRSRSREISRSRVASLSAAFG